MDRLVTREFLKWASGKGQSKEGVGIYKGKPVTIRAFYKRALVLRGIVSDRYKGGEKRLMLCPFHGDEKPSMGTFVDGDGLEMFKCFGCKRAGTVEDLANGVEIKFHRRFYDTPLEWVVRACSGDLGYSEMLRFEATVQKESSERPTLGYSPSDDAILRSVNTTATLRKRSIVEEYASLAEDLRKNKVLDLNALQRAFIASFVAV